jgi:uncharacterized protein (TIGR00369 family)
MAAESLNPDFTIDVFKERLAAAGKTFPTDLGIEPLEFGEKACRGRIVADDRHLHPGRLVHGGVWVGLGDTVAAWPTFRHLPTGYDFTTIELKLNALAPGRPGDELVATARHLHAGRSTHVLAVDIERGDGRLAAHLIVTQFVIPPRAEG